jgi:preprotein translocase subunit YajC
MNIILSTIGILLLILIIFFVLKIRKRKQIQQKELQKIRVYGERLNNKTRNRRHIR